MALHAVCLSVCLPRTITPYSSHHLHLQLHDTQHNVASGDGQGGQRAFFAGSSMHGCCSSGIGVFWARECHLLVVWKLEAHTHYIHTSIPSARCVVPASARCVVPASRSKATYTTALDDKSTQQVVYSLQQELVRRIRDCTKHSCDNKFPRSFS